MTDICDENLNVTDKLSEESGTSMRVGDASLIYHNVPGDGNCFFHAIAGAFIKSKDMWEYVKDKNGITLCDKITESWIWFLKDNPSATPEENFDQGFFRFIAASQITDESVRLFRDVNFENPDEISLEQARRDFENHILRSGTYGDEYSLTLLNKYLEGFIRLHIYDEVTSNWVGPGDSDHAAYILVSLKNEHYKLLQFRGEYDSFLIARKQMERDAPRLLMTLLGLPNFDS